MDFSALNRFFDHIYIVTVERHGERQDKMRETLQGLDFDFFFGADKKQFTLDELIEEGIYDEKLAIKLHRFNKPMNTTQVSCSWSHRMVYEDMLENNYKKVLVLEDDVVPNKEGIAAIELMIDELPKDWELWYLDYHKNLRRNLGTYLTQLLFHIKRLMGKCKWSCTTINNYFARKYKEHLFIAGYHNFSSAYAITQSAARKLIKMQTPIKYCSDHLLAEACSNRIVKGFVSCPKVFLNESQMQEMADKKTKASYISE